MARNAFFLAVMLAASGLSRAMAAPAFDSALLLANGSFHPPHGTVSDVNAASAVPDSFGGAFVSGRFTGTATFGAAGTFVSRGQEDAFVLRVSGEGVVLWAVQVGGATRDWTNTNGLAAAGADGALLLGISESEVGDDVSVLRVDHAGSIEILATLRRMPHDRQQDSYQAAGAFSARAIVSDDAGGALLACEVFRGNVTLDVSTPGASTLGHPTMLEWSGVGQSDAYVLRIRNDGAIAWARRVVAATVHLLADGMAPDGGGGALLSGMWIGDATFGTSTPTQLASDEASAGWDTYAGDIFICHISGTSGDVNWAVGAGGPQSDRALGIATDGDGGAYVTGWFSAPATFGATRVPAQFPGDGGLFVFHCSRTGAIEWVAAAAGVAPTCDGGGRECIASVSAGSVVAPDGGGGVVVGGYFGGTVTLGTTTLVTRSTRPAGYVAEDLVVLRVSASGEIEWALPAYAAASGPSAGKFGILQLPSPPVGLIPVACGWLVVGSHASTDPSPAFGGGVTLPSADFGADTYVAHFAPRVTAPLDTPGEWSPSWMGGGRDDSSYFYSGCAYNVPGCVPWTGAPTEWFGRPAGSGNLSLDFALTAGETGCASLRLQYAVDDYVVSASLNGAALEGPRVGVCTGLACGPHTAPEDDQWTTAGLNSGLQMISARADAFVAGRNTLTLAVANSQGPGGIHVRGHVELRQPPPPSPPAMSPPRPAPPAFTCETPPIEVVAVGGEAYCGHCTLCSGYCPHCDD